MTLLQIREFVHFTTKGRQFQKRAKIDEIMEKHKKAGSITSIASNEDLVITPELQEQVMKDMAELKETSRRQQCCVFLFDTEFYSIWWHKLRTFAQCYFVALRHGLDQVTDVAVIIEFMNLYLLEKSNGEDYCPVINPGYLLSCSIMSFLCYRIVSGVFIWHITGKPKRFFLQLLDLELFRALGVNYVANSKTPCNPQRWIQSLEAVLESTPQAFIQLFYIAKTSVYGETANIVVFLSLIYSIWSIANKSTSEDKIAFKRVYQNIKKSKKNMYDGGYIGGKEKYAWYDRINWGYIARILYRIVDVIYRVSVFFLTWIVCGGVWAFIILVVEVSVIFYFCKKYDELSLVFKLHSVR